ncbi:hypothetical protein [Thermomonospora umbrina]|uniref:ABC-type branched-subunit amino acid transport system substrate-binding protein n=1 Tax=Thermomonospora umbrina TaxID=111806 RepID=A0A3D9SME5_9ACTN|nr:hypothetical protein [Thermomonospora umbrina]REE97106.1 ABC-type branched-subunit amino acid transport system substrate-binding protein [Thermomonospora umbrina]
MGDNVFSPTRPPSRPGPPRKWIAAAAAVVLVIALVLGVGALRGDDAVTPPRAAECAPGIARVDVVVNDTTMQRRKECVGVTDSHDFGSPAIRRLLPLLRKENDHATQGGPGTYVTVAFLGPLTGEDPRIVHMLEGAVTGQHRANQENLVGSRPRVRLVLANTDSRQSSWRPVVATLKRMVGGGDHLAAVTGLGLSQKETLDTAHELSKVSMPMVGSVITADTLNSTRVRGLVAVNPRTGEQVSVLRQYLRTVPAIRRIMLVSSGDPDDLYTTSLVDAFKLHLGDYSDGSEYPFGPTPGDEFNTIVKNLCSQDGEPPDAVFYAGRARDLPTFVEYLAKRSCHPERITILSGSDAVRLTLDIPDNAKMGEYLTRAHNPISVIYAPLVEPSLLEDPPGRPGHDGENLKQNYADFVRSYQQLGFHPGRLNSAWGIMAHDSVLLAVGAIRLVKNPQQGGLPLPAEVRNQLYLISTSATSVPGASGPLTISSAGDRKNVRLPVLQLVIGSTPKLLTPDLLSPKPAP